MPRLFPEPVLQNFLTHHTHALPLSSLPEDDPLSLQCPICHNPYSAQDPSYLHPLSPISLSDPEGTEYPVQVKDRGTCRHIFGRRCIERHIRADQPWSHSCPLCRVEWFPPSVRSRTRAVVEVERALNALSRIESLDDEVRAEVRNVEGALEIIRELLYESRWM
ncbi:hypothetical protein CC80DRAFT_554857 [Byssothecium circinans]|uniref:RING-type domain-containing protein n=1 Tax=Byssothecium circinans TaxID=147558 RepID=A0A6A5TGM2_9PLEO|nr:hypothetical protein CC80DRAFT_554857 [Byssothecium circinans]